MIVARLRIQPRLDHLVRNYRRLERAPAMSLLVVADLNRELAPRRLLESYDADPKSTVMCGRYASFLSADALARIFGMVNPLPSLEPTWNMAPTLDAPVVRQSKDGERHLDTLKWGLIPYFTKDLKKARKPINARSETIAKSGMFREAFAKRRCLVPTPVYYEWRDDPEGKTPFAVARVDGEPAAFGGIWETCKSPEGEYLRTFATITTEANQLLAGIQDRMPVIIERADCGRGRGGFDAGGAGRRAPHLVCR